MHVRVKKALHVHGANSFRPLWLMPPKGKVAGREKGRRRGRFVLYQCEKSEPSPELESKGKVCVCVCVTASWHGKGIKREKGGKD